MVIRFFVISLLILATISYFIPVENKTKADIYNEIAVLIFTDSTTYTLTTDSMNRIIYSKKILRYNNRDVMLEGALTLKSKDKQNKEVTDILYSDIIIKRDDNFEFLNNVKYQRDKYIMLNTNELNYNAKTKIATNSLPFYGTYYNNKIEGKNIYLDINKYYMKAKDIHFEINIEEK